MNRQTEMEDIIAGFAGRRRSLLLHGCCAPCSSYVLEYLTEFFDITLFYYNPNIMPPEEYEKRLDAVKKLLSVLPQAGDVRLIAGEYEPDAFLRASRGLESEPEGGARCAGCFELRLGKAASLAAGLKTDFVTTTLTISPHKDAELINRVGQTVSERAGVRWLPCDFKKKGGYQRSIELCRQYGIYRQSWCGCSFARGGRE